MESREIDSFLQICNVRDQIIASDDDSGGGLNAQIYLIPPQDGKYRVRLKGEWIVVPDSALITEPNRYGPAVVWPYRDADGTTQIRCFLPGAGA